jgi:hypothetical protein
MYFFGFSNSAWAEGVLTPSNGLGHRLCSFCLAINRLYLSAVGQGRILAMAVCLRGLEIRARARLMLG